MRLPRIKLPHRNVVYHCVSRIVGRQNLLNDSGKEFMVHLLWKMAGFCGLEVITYCFMSNHFHILIRIPKQAEVSDLQLLDRLAGLYGKKGVLTTLARESMTQLGHIDDYVRTRILARMGDISEFMKEFKQRFSRWYNRQHNREGTLWSERFRSVLVEDQPTVVEAVAAYIDLNPVRAGLVEDPKDYRFCGYAAALTGNKLARKGLMSIQGEPSRRAQAFELSAHTENTSNSNPLNATEHAPRSPVQPVPSLSPSPADKPPLNLQTLAPQKSPAPSTAHWNSWPECAAEYRIRLFTRAGSVHQSGKRILNKEKIRSVLRQGGKLSAAEVFRLRVRCLTDGVALGTKSFVNEVFTQYRERFSQRRKDGARPLRFLATEGLSVLRDLKVRALS